MGALLRGDSGGLGVVQGDEVVQVEEVVHGEEVVQVEAVVQDEEALSRFREIVLIRLGDEGVDALWKGDSGWAEVQVEELL